eukprot:Lankesteria_metandrocarpae@DN1049_c0_g1_i1.p1
MRCKRSLTASNSQHNQKRRGGGNVLLEAHPEGLMPGGNSFLRDDSQNRSAASRALGLGRIISTMSDKLVLQVLEFCSGSILIRLQRCSRYMRAFANHDDLWQHFALALMDDHPQLELNFTGSWSSSYKSMKRTVVGGSELWAGGSTLDKNVTILTTRVDDAACNKRKAGTSYNEHCVHDRDLHFISAPDASVGVNGANGANRVRHASSSSSLLKGVYSDLLFQRWHCARVQLHSSWLRRESMVRASAANGNLTPQRFVKNFEAKSIPLIITDLISDWPALTKWTFDKLVTSEASSAEAAFQCGPAKLKLRDFHRYAYNNADEAPLFVFCPKFADTVPALASDYIPPNIFCTGDYFKFLSPRPLYRWLLIGNDRSGSKWHIDPNATHAWNAVTAGAKRWLMTPPHRPPPGVFPSPDGAFVAQPLSLIDWYLQYYKEAQARGDLLEGTCHAGEVVFIPSGWWHAVLNIYDGTVAVTQNYCSQSNLKNVRDFFRTKVDQISGVDDQRRCSLRCEFDEALVRNGIQFEDGSDDEAKAAAQQRVPVHKEEGGVGSKHNSTEALTRARGAGTYASGGKCVRGHYSSSECGVGVWSTLMNRGHTLQIGNAAKL